MANEAIRDYGAWVDLEANGASIASAAFGEAAVASFSLATSGGSRPHLEFELEWTHGTAPTGNSPVHLYARDLNLFAGANHALAPSATNLQRQVAIVQCEASVSTQRRRFDVLNAPADASYWIRNGSNQTISVGWKLRARAWTLKPA